MALLAQGGSPAEAYAQWASSTVLCDTYLVFAKWIAGVIIVIWGPNNRFSTDRAGSHSRQGARMVRGIRRLRPSAGESATGKRRFNRQYEEAERRRAAILNRLAGLNDAARTHPAYRRALTLLNQTFRKVSLSQRPAVLEAAEWLIDVVESISTRSGEKRPRAGTQIRRSGRKTLPRLR